MIPTIAAGRGFTPTASSLLSVPSSSKEAQRQARPMATMVGRDAEVVIEESRETWVLPMVIQGGANNSSSQTEPRSLALVGNLSAWSACGV